MHAAYETAVKRLHILEMFYTLDQLECRNIYIASFAKTWSESGEISDVQFDAQVYGYEQAFKHFSMLTG